MRRIAIVVIGLLSMLGLVVVLFTAWLLARSNFHTVVRDSVYRSAQPTARQFEVWHERYGIATVINLRGSHPHADWYKQERSATERLGIRLIDVPLSSDEQLTAGRPIS